MARNKATAASVLRATGLPVPPHALAKSVEDAIRCAEKLGYPVVVKPVDLDGGKGVKANLLTPEEVRKAFSAALELSKNILVEKHVPGRDYRIQVVNGDVHGVLDRVPGGVTVNGLDTVRALLERQNHERMVAVDDRRYLHQMEFDEEAREQLRAHGMDWDSVPGNGRFVRLRGASNVASGGVPVPIPLNEVHPDNLALAVRAARVLRLDVAGIDLLIPNIEQSWLEAGAHICEVNAQPQMFTTMHKPMLVSLLNGGDGRVPVAMVMPETSTDSEIASKLHRELLAQGVNAGLVCGGRVWVGRDCVSGNSCGSFAGAVMLRHDPAVEAMVICIDDDEIMSRGWPVDRCDVLVVRPGRPRAVFAGGQYSLAQWLGAAAALLPRLVIFDPTSDKQFVANARSVFGSTSKDLRVAVEAADRVVPTALEAIQSAAGRQKAAGAGLATRDSAYPGRPDPPRRQCGG